MELTRYKKPDEIAQVCTFLVARHYYVSGFLGQKILKSPEAILDLVIARQDGVVSGWCLICRKDLVFDTSMGLPDARLIACYVDPAYRRRGIGTAMVKAINPDDDVVHGFGIPASVPFWDVALRSQIRS